MLFLQKDEADSDDSSEEEDVDAAQADEDKNSFMECCERLGEKVEGE